MHLNLANAIDTDRWVGAEILPIVIGGLGISSTKLPGFINSIDIPNNWLCTDNHHRQSITKYS